MSSPQKTIWIATLCLAMTLIAAMTHGQTIEVAITSTASELWGQEPDVFGVAFWSDHDVRISQIIFDLSFANGDLYFDTTPHDNGAYDFTVLPDVWFPTTISDDTGVSHLSADWSKHLVLNFTHFEPGETLYFDIDVDGIDNGAWTADQFAGTAMGVVIDLEPAFPGADPQGLIMYYENIDGLVVAQFQEQMPVPEPATFGLMSGGAALLAVCIRRKRRRRSC